MKKIKKYAQQAHDEAEYLANGEYILNLINELLGVVNERLEQEANAVLIEMKEVIGQEVGITYKYNKLEDLMDALDEITDIIDD